MPTIQPNNNTSLYNAAGGNTIPINGNITANNINVSNNVNVGGQISATGNITTAGFFIGDGSQLTNLPISNYSNANVANYLPTFTGNLTAGNISAVGQVTGANLKALTDLVVGNPLTDNSTVTNAGLVIVTSPPAGGANVYPGVVSVSNISGSSYMGANISTTGNVTGNYIIGDGSQLTNLPLGNYSNANVANYLPTFSGNLAGGNLNITTAGNTWTVNNDQLTAPSGGFWQSNATTNDDYISGTPGGYLNLQALHANNAQASNVHLEQTLVHISAESDTWTFENGNITLPGNTSAINYANGVSILNGISGNYGNANVVSLLSALGSNTISTTGTVTSGNVIGTNLFTTGVVSATGNVTGNFFIGDGSQLTNLPVGNYSNANVANYLPTFTGNLTAGNISASGNIQSNSVIKVGNIQLSGTSAGTIDRIFTLGNIQIGASDKWGSDGDLNISGNLVANTGTAGTGWFNYVVSGNSINAGGLLQGANIQSTGYVSAVGNVTGNFFIGNGSQLTGITTSYGNANVATFLAAFGSNTISTTGTVTSGNLFTSGQVSATGNINGANVVSSSFQAVNSGGGALKNASGSSQLSWGAAGGDNLALNVSTNINGANAQVDISPTGTGHVHIKPTGTNSVEIAPTSAGSINNMIIGNVTPANVFATVVSASGNVTGNYFIGDGSQLTNLPVGNYSNANVVSLMAAFGSNTISTTGTVTSGNITGSNIATAGIITATGNITAGNILTAGVMSAAGANVGNALWLDSAGAAAIRSNGANLFISNLGNTTTTVRLGGSATTISVGNTSNTSIQANTTITMGGLVNIIGGANVGGAAGLNVNNGANIVISSGNLTIGGNAGIAYIKTTSATGYVFNTANIIYIGNQSSNTGNAIISGNIVGNLAISATGNISTNSFITVKSYTVAALTAITGSIGQQAAVSDATPGGRMAFWDTTNSRWSYINDNSAV